MHDMNEKLNININVADIIYGRLGPAVGTMLRQKNLNVYHDRGPNRSL